MACLRRCSPFVLLLLAACAHSPAPPPASTPTAPPATAPAVAKTAEPTWKRHDENRPQPRIARPATALTTRAPADATVLFDGSSLAAWRADNDGPAAWRISNGELEVTGGSALHTTQPYGDMQLHVEWSAPLPPEGEGEQRGNSGIVFMGKYELQVLDSYGNNTIADTHAGAIYGQTPPLVNASLPPGEWQSFDVVFHAPRFENGQLVRPARMTVLQNGVLVQDDVVIVGATSNNEAGSTQPHAARLPLYLQNGGQPVRYRNIWIRELDDGE